MKKQIMCAFYIMGKKFCFQKKAFNILTNKVKADIIFRVEIGEGGGIGRRARLRGVWFIPCEFKSRPSHQLNIAGWCKGSTSDSDSLCTGSNPVPAANTKARDSVFFCFGK